MRFSRLVLLTGALCGAGVMAQDRKPDGTAADTGTVIRVETRLVLVDVVATDRKGNYVRDLTAGDFRVWEDDKEQTIKSFSFEAADASAVNTRTRYMVLFFDDVNMSPADQVTARKAAAQFIGANAGADRMIAVIDYTGTLRIVQNFTADAEKLRRAVSGVKVSLATDFGQIAPPGQQQFSLGAAAGGFGTRNDLVAIESLARGLAQVPGRKTLVWLTSGFSLDPLLYSEIKAAISECNKANVSVYPIDIRGLVAPNAFLVSPAGRTSLVSALWEGGARPFLEMAAFGLAPVAFAMPQQRGGGSGGTGTGSGSTGGSGGTGGTGSTGGGSKGGGTGGTGSTGGTKGGTTTGTGSNGNNGNYNNNGYYGNNGINGINGYNGYNTNQFGRSGFLIPQVQSGVGNQRVMYMLAEGTGGFVIVNTNNLLGAFQKIATDQDQYYLIGYEPAETVEGHCHSLRVKVNRGGISLRSRTAYCNVPPQDLLAGSPVEKELEKRVSAAEPGEIAGSLADPFFYTSPNTARVNVAMDLPVTEIKTEKVKGKLHAEMHVLGIAYRADGKAAARFSDTMKLDFNDKKELDAFTKQPLHYENEFAVAAGSYTLKLAFSLGHKFGKLETPLVVEPWDGKHFSMSGVAFSNSVHRLDQADGLDAELLQGRTPLVAQGVEITPAAAHRSKKAGMSVLYVEVYEPSLAEPNPPQVGLQLRLFDRKTGKVALDRGMFSVASAVRAGNPVIPVAVKLPLDSLAPGSYRAELRATDSKGRQTMLRATDFDLEP